MSPRVRVLALLLILSQWVFVWGCGMRSTLLRGDDLGRDSASPGHELGSGGFAGMTGAAGGHGSGGRTSLGGTFAGGASAGDGGEPARGGAHFACQSGTFETQDAGQDVLCQPWRDCVPGEYVVSEPSQSVDRVCAECFWGTFSTERNVTHCSPWAECGPDEVAEPGSPIRDSACTKPLPTSNEHILGPHTTGKMVVTSEGAYLLGQSDPTAVAFVLHFSLEGKLLSTWRLGDSNTSVNAIVAVGTDIVVAGASSEGAKNLAERAGYVRKYSASGALLWERSLDEGLYTDSARVATNGSELAVATAPFKPDECWQSNVVGVLSSGCRVPGSASVVLRHYDLEGALIATQVLDLRVYNELSAFDMTMDGRTYVGGKSSEPYPGGYLAEVSPGGAVLSRHDSGALGFVDILALSRDTAGRLYVLSDYSNPSIPHLVRRVHQFSATGEEVWQHKIGGYMLPEIPYDLVTTDDGVVAVGQLYDGMDMLVMTFSTEGEAQSENVIAGTDWETLTAVAAAPSGQVYLGGYSQPEEPFQGGSGEEQGPQSFFVFPWPDP